MMRFCTYFDVNYLTRGVALHRSLVAQREPFELHIVCLDQDTRRAIEKLGLTSTKLYDLDELERFDPDLAATKSTRAKYEYYWTMTPCVPLFLFARDPAIESIAYLDADLFFFSSPQPLFDELHDASALIVEHAYTPGLRTKPVGRFNVGSITFKNDDAGRAVLRDWRARCIEWCFDRLEPGRYGDQAYLDEWPGRFGAAVAIAKHDGIGVGPWNERARVGERGSLKTGAPIVYYHFHGLRLLGTHVVRATGYRLSKNARRYLYAPYFAALDDAVRDVERAGCGRPGLLGYSAKNLVGGIARRDLTLFLGRRVVALR